MIAGHGLWLPPGRAGTFDEVVDGAGRNLVVMDHHRNRVACGTASELPLGRFTPHREMHLLLSFQRCEPDINTALWSGDL